MTADGLPGWVPGEYLSAEETVALGDLDLWAHQSCGWCGYFLPLDRVPIVRGPGRGGPTERLCKTCRRLVEGLLKPENREHTMAVRRDMRVFVLSATSDRRYSSGVRVEEVAELAPIPCG